MNTKSNHQLNHHPSRLNSKLGQRLGMILVIIPIIGLLFWAFTQPGFAQALNQATTVQPERYTELYFTNHHAVPPEAPPGQGVRIPFTIVNHESQPTSYHYRVTVTDGQTTQVIEEGSILLADGQKSNHIAIYTPDHSGQNTQVTIQLIDQQQVIHIRIQS